MDHGGNPEIPPFITDGPDSTTVTHAGNGGGVSPAVPTPPTGGSKKQHDPTPGARGLKSDRQSVGASIEEGEISNTPYSRALSVNSVTEGSFPATFLVTLLTLFAFLLMTWFTVLRDARSTNNQVLSTTNTTVLSILGHSPKLDLDVLTVLISWEIFACGVFLMSPDRVSEDAHILGGCSPPDGVLDVYLNDPSKPILSYNPYRPVGGALSIMDQLSFTKEHCIDKNGKWNPTRNLMALFEHYSFHAFAFAIDPTANRSVHIATFAVVDAAGDFVVRSRDAAAANKFTHDSGDGFMTTAMEVESRVLRVDFELSAIAKMAAICPFLVNWALTIGSIYVTTLMTLGKLEANGTVAVLPFGALLIIMAVRFFSSRPLGTTTDAVVLFVQTATIGLCSLVFLRALTQKFGSPSSSPTSFSV